MDRDTGKNKKEMRRLKRTKEHNRGSIVEAVAVLSIIFVAAGIGYIRTYGLVNPINMIRNGSGAHLSKSTSQVVEISDYAGVDKGKTDGAMGSNISKPENKEYYGDEISGYTSEDGRFIGVENGEISFVEISEGVAEGINIEGIKPGDSVYDALDSLKAMGATENYAMEQYWAEQLLSDGKMNQFILSYDYTDPKSNKTINYIVTVDTDTVISVSAKQK